MVDGTGMCGACRVTIGGKTKFTCVDGPEFDAHLVDFDEAIRRDLKGHAVQSTEKTQALATMAETTEELEAMYKQEKFKLKNATTNEELDTSMFNVVTTENVDKIFNLRSL